MVRRGASTLRICSVRLAQKHLFHFEPVVDSLVAGDADVVRRTVEYSLARKTPQLAGIVVDQIIRTQNAFIAAVDYVRRGDERKVFRQPPVLRLKRRRDRSTTCVPSSPAS